MGLDCLNKHEFESAEDSHCEAAEDSHCEAVVRLDEWITRDAVDEVGYLQTGKLLEWMHMVAVLAASRHCGAPVATASVDGIRIGRPLRVGDRISLAGRVVHTSPHSVSVLVDVTVDKRPSLAAYLTFVMISRDGQVEAVPPFKPRGPNELTRYNEAEARRVERKRLHAVLESASPSAAKSSLTETAPITIDTSLSDPLASDWTPTRRPGNRQGARLCPVAVGGQGTTDGQGPDPARIAELLKRFPENLRCPWDAAVPGGGQRSYVHFIEAVRKPHLNPAGCLHGGTATRWLERAACLSARAWLGHAPARLVALQGLTFLRPATERQFVHMRAMVVHTEPEALTVLVAVHIEDPVENRQSEAVRALFSYMPTHPMPVAELVCTTDDETQMFREAARRVALHRTLGSS